MYKRRGFTVLEVLVAIILVATLLTVSLEFLHALALQRRSLSDRRLALQEAGNCMERIAVWPWDELTTERLSGIDLSPEIRRALPSAKLSIRVSPTPEPPQGKVVSVTIRWQEQPEQPERSVRLVTWRYRQGE